MIRRLSALGCALLLQACTSPAPAPPQTTLPAPATAPAPLAGPSTIYTGTLSYPAGIALPPDTDALVEVMDSRSERVLASTRFALDGRQAPVPFTLEAPAAGPDDAQLLRAAFVVNGRKRWRSQALPVSPSRTALGALTLGPIAPSIAQYRCGDLLVGFSSGEDGRADLVLPSRSLVLTQRETASGAKYVSADDPDTWFWSKGRTASVSLAGQLLPSCEEIGP